jgi:hypothetical protein
MDKPTITHRISTPDDSCFDDQAEAATSRKGYHKVMKKAVF